MWFGCDDHFHNHNDVDTVLLIQPRGEDGESGRNKYVAMGDLWEKGTKSSSSSVESRE